MDGVVHLWNEWEVQILMLFSFVLQLSLLTFSRMRRRNISAVPRTLLWLAYLLADSIAIYILGHMSISCQPREHRQLMAFWAPFLLVHLGGQDTMTAYAMEDNQLWPRHLLSLVTQAVGVAYVLYKYISGSSGSLVMAGVLIFVAGVAKYGERIWALKSARLDNLRMFLNNVEKPRLLSEIERGDQYSVGRIEDDSEEVLRGAHYLLPICMGQFVDYKFWPSPSQSEAMKQFADKGCLYKLTEMQLSLMHDVLYTKAAVIHTWCGFFIHAVASVATIFAYLLFKSSNGKENHNRVDVIVTYTLLAGALLLEMVSLLGAVGSTWTCALLRSTRWNRLHSTVAWVRQLVKAAERIRRWSGSIGQHNLLNKYVVGESHRSSVEPVSLFHSSSVMISAGTKRLVLEEIDRMVGACEGEENTMRRYRGQCAMKPYERFFGDLTSWSTDVDFDDSVLDWHFATDLFILFCQQQAKPRPIVEAIKALSNYMVFLLQEHPHMLPSPARPVLYSSPIEADLHSRSDLQKMIQDIKVGTYGEVVPSFARGAELAERLLELDPHMPELLQVVLGVWVEMLCYAAHHCSGDSHARQLNSGGEFITIVWLLTSAVFNRSYCDMPWFKESARKFFLSRGGAGSYVLPLVGLPLLVCILPLVLLARACQAFGCLYACQVLCLSARQVGGCLGSCCLSVKRWCKRSRSRSGGV